MPSPYLRGGAPTTPFWGAATSQMGAPTNFSGTASSITKTITVGTAPVVGDLMIAVLCWTPNSNTDTFVVTDSKGHTWTTVVKRTDSGGTVVAIGMAIAKCVTAPVGGTDTFTATPTATSHDMILGGMKETTQNWLGVVDGSNSVQGTTATTLSPGTLTPSVRFCWCVQAFANAGAPAGTGSPGGGFTELWDTASAPSGVLRMQFNVANLIIGDTSVQNVSETVAGTHTQIVGCQMLLRMANPIKPIGVAKTADMQAAIMAGVR